MSIMDTVGGVMSIMEGHVNNGYCWWGHVNNAWIQTVG